MLTAPRNLDLGMISRLGFSKHSYGSFFFFFNGAVALSQVGPGENLGSASHELSRQWTDLSVSFSGVPVSHLT